MDVLIAEGRLVEKPAPHARGVDRRAFGEFVGPAGELVSYALGWTTGDDHGRLSIGFGCHNSGGGTIHALVYATEDSHDFELVDTPFEAVPEGGPDLTAHQARAHEDMPFMWWAADWIFQHDRRAWWLRHWLLQTKCIQTQHVFQQAEPVLRIRHDTDGQWQLAESHDVAQHGPVGQLSHAIDADHSLLGVLDLKPGQSASRPYQGGPWTRHPEDPAAAH